MTKNNALVIGNKYISIQAISRATKKGDNLEVYFHDNSIPLFLVDEDARIMWARLVQNAQYKVLRNDNED